MITRDVRQWVHARAALPVDRPACLSAALLVEPTGFRVSAQSASDNVYMDPAEEVDPERAQAQLWGLAAVLTRIGAPVVVLPGRPGLDDAIYPNNAYGFAPGRFILGRMRHPVRQGETARADVRALFHGTFGYALHDLSTGAALAELTGVLATDWSRGATVCGMSSRVELAGVRAMHEAFDLRLTLLAELVPDEYHLNLVLAVLAGEAAVMWDDGFADPDVAVELSRAWPGRVLHLTADEKNAYAGNLLAVTPRDVVISGTAWDGLGTASRSWFSEQGFRVHPVPVDELEKGGGSLRCLIAEIF